jgi:hypothetical protein
MKTFNSVDEFVKKILPEEYKKILRQQKTPIEEFVENADIDFDNKLKKIIKGEETGGKEQEKEKK